ncbi:MAG: hypothetical protein BWY57_02511 [Betaproteobacteria bacterium ADurb.Bin341]|nr:MAG: hypothetical protein BWY57_02511 [Betaproteobacteria bacterium ADurb.Bin341]
MPALRLAAPLALLTLALALAGCSTAGRAFYVSPEGRDDGPGSRRRPFQTLTRAQAAARAARAETPDAPVTVHLRGTFTLPEPLVFTPEDSGTASAPVTYTSYPGETAVLSGGRPLSGAWRQAPGRPYWQLDVPHARETSGRFNTLFINGESRLRARTPNWGEKPLRAAGREPGGDPRQALRYREGDFDPAWSNPTHIDVVLLGSWTPTLHRLREVDPARRALRFFSAHGRPVDFWERNFRYYLSNVFEALDQPGEWYLDPSGTLSYYPLPGEDMATVKALAPAPRTAPHLLLVRGDLAGRRPVEHLHFRNLAFRHTESSLDRFNGAYRQGHMFLPAAVTAHGLRHASFEGCTFSQLGDYAVELADGCRDVTVRRCHFWDLGAGALQLGVSDLGNRFASRTRITHNDISDTHWDAIGLDARWNWKGERHAHGIEVAYNRLHHLGLRYQTDAAAIYQFGPLDTHIHHNVIHDTAAYPYICGYAGVYLDEQSRGATVENNLVYNVDWYAYFQHKGVDNLFRNNIGAFARDGLLLRGGLNELWTSNHLEACRNIYIASNAVAIRQDWQPGLRPPLLYSNLYHTLASDTAPTFAGKPLAEWQALGRELLARFDEPGVFRLTATPGAGFTVTDEVPGTRGPHCLRCVDRKGLAKAFYPYMHVAPRALTSGHITFSFAARLPAPSEAAPFTVELRGKATAETGPSLSFATDGTVRANGRPVCTLPPGQWAAFTLAFALGPARTGSYTLTVRNGTSTAIHTFPFSSPDFTQLAWLGVTAPSDTDGRFYLDALTLDIRD